MRIAMSAVVIITGTFVPEPSTSGAWRLQVTTNLDSPIVWTNNLSPTSTVGNAFRVTRPATNSLEVFRLIRP